MQCAKYQWWKVPLLLPKSSLFYELILMWYLATKLNVKVSSGTRYSHNYWNLLKSLCFVSCQKKTKPSRSDVNWHGYIHTAQRQIHISIAFCLVTRFIGMGLGCRVVWMNRGVRLSDWSMLSSHWPTPTLLSTSVPTFSLITLCQYRWTMGFQNHFPIQSLCRSVCQSR